jgi:SWI/SNF-related matrix-associated actin-dependent regulator of chromatin subfamily A3
MAPANSTRKRPAEVIDLTDDLDDTASSASQRAPKTQKRDATSSHAYPSSSSSAFSGSSQGAPQRQYLSSSSTSVYPGTQTFPGASQTHIGDDEFTDDELDDVTLSQSFRDHSEYVLYGTINTKAVGCRFYNGYVTMGEMVLIRREPNNQYDSNAIQVKNAQVSSQVGNLRRGP